MYPRASARPAFLRRAGIAEAELCSQGWMAASSCQVSWQLQPDVRSDKITQPPFQMRITSKARECDEAMLVCAWLSWDKSHFMCVIDARLIVKPSA